MVFCESPNEFGYPCGKCRACRLKKANQKFIQSIYATDYYKKLYIKQGQFLTLTFNDEHLPDGLKHEVFSGFMKRLRKIDKTPDVKMTMAGEYGEENHREHFHVLFYNHKYSIDDVNAAWIDVDTKEPLGFTYDGTLSPESMKYVCGYINKKGYVPDSGKRPPYGRSSVGIPDGMNEREIERMCRTGKVVWNGREYAAPDLYKRRYAEKWKEYESYRARERRKKRDEEFWELEKRFNHDSRKICDYLESYVNYVKSRMDERERKQMVRKALKKEKRLQKAIKRRIM